MSTIQKFKTVEKIYKPSRLPQRRNPVYRQKLRKRVVCKYCIEQITNVSRRKYYHSLNQLWGHFSYEHQNIDFSSHLMDLADQVMEGELL